MSSLHFTKAQQTRRCIMMQLYDLFRKVPLAPVELRGLAESCRVEARELNWNIVYLEKKGWLTLSHDINCPPYVSCYAELTGAGIDLVEDTVGFEKQFSEDDAA